MSTPTVSLASFQRDVRQFDGEWLATQQSGKRFRLHVTSTGLTYTPESSGKERPDTWTSVRRVLERFNSSPSWRPADYHDITHHSSYVLAVLRRIMEPVPQSSSPAAVEKTGQFAYVDPMKVRRMTPAVALPKAPLEAKPHQRVGSVSNAHVGADFEQVALRYFAGQGVQLIRNFPVEIGLSVKKIRNFDLGSHDPKVLVECKSHTWTAGARVPSAKMTVWNEAMYYFSLAPAEYRKVLFVLHNRRDDDGESLLAYYKRTYPHLIPDGVEFLEWDESTGDIAKL